MWGLALTESADTGFQRREGEGGGGLVDPIRVVSLFLAES